MAQSDNNKYSERYRARARARARYPPSYEAQFFILITGTSVTARWVSLEIRSIKPTARALPFYNQVSIVRARSFCKLLITARGIHI